MKKSIALILIMVLLGLGTANASVELSVNNYYPMPVEAGDYFNVFLKVANTGASSTDSIIKFKPSFPFSVDNNATSEETITNLDAGSAVTKKFKIRVDAGSKEGDNSLIFQYTDCEGCNWKEKSVPITIIEAQTTFDIVLQEINEEGIFIAIANIGKNSANAVTVRIPEQENFKTQLVSASIVGNLESGDYTLVGFQIIPKSKDSEEKELLIQIDYTDPLGIRRSVSESLMLSPNVLTEMSSKQTTVSTTTKNGTKTSFFSGFWFWILIIIVSVKFGIKLYKKFKHKKKV